MPHAATAKRPAPRFERSQIVQSARLGRIDYAAANEWQQRRALSVAEGSSPEIVLLHEHPPTYTQGRRGGREHLRVPESELCAPVIDTDRGGDLTFHGPGQLVAWPILRIRERGIGIGRYVRLLEESAILTASHFGVQAGRLPGRPGVWVGDRKLASIGVRVQRGVSRHGLALNVDTDLRWFDSITPCGIAGVEMTSLSGEIGAAIPMPDVAQTFERAFAAAFGLRLAPVELDRDGS